MSVKPKVPLNVLTDNQTAYMSTPRKRTNRRTEKMFIAEITSSGAMFHKNCRLRLTDSFSRKYSRSVQNCEVAPTLQEPSSIRVNDSTVHHCRLAVQTAYIS